MLLRMMMAGAPATGLPNFDDFNANTIASYTVTQDSGGPTWVVASGEMATSSVFATQSVCRRNSFSQADVVVETVVDSATDSGLVLRFQDQNNFYLLTLSDASGQNPSQKLRIFKRVGGSFTQLGSSYNFTWARGTQITVRFEAIGTALNAYVNEDVVLAVTDSAIASAGAIGMRANGAGGDAFKSLAWG